MINICFFCGDSSLGGGTERVSSLLASSMAKSGKYCVYILSVCNKNQTPVYPVENGVVRDVIRSKPVESLAGYMTLFFPLRAYLKKHKIQVLVDVDSVLDIISMPARMLRNVKIISWEHFDFDETLGTSYRTRLRRITAQKTDAVVTLTHGNAVRYNNEFKLKRNARCIRNIVLPSSDEKYDSTSRTIMTAGALVPVKGFDMLVTAASYVFKAHPEYTWKLFGEGEQKKELEEKIASLGISGKLELCGFADDLAPYYRSACMYVLTSRSEGLPTVMTEAKKFKLPIIAFDSSYGVSELIENGVNGLLVPLGDERALADAICRLIEDDNLRNSFSAHSGDGMEEFTREYVLSEWDALIEDVLR